LCVLNSGYAADGSAYRQIGETKQEIMLDGIQQGFMKIFFDESLEGCNRMNLFLI
jgi:hypothetical protein